MTRRQFLQAVSVCILWAISLGLIWRSGWLQHLGRQVLVPRLDSSSETGSLSEDELETVVSFGEILVKGSLLSVEEREHLIEHIGYRTENTPGYLSVYRGTAQRLNSLALTRFSSLDLGARQNIMDHHRFTSSRIRIHEYFLPFHRKELAIRRLAVTDLITGYYRSPAGWALVGYSTFPGRCSDLIRYTRPENA